MKILTIDVADQATVNQRFKSAMQGQVEGAHVSFPSLELFHKLMTPRRLRLIESIQQMGPVRLRELARRLDRDAGNLVRDLKPLREWGVVEDTDDGLIVPFDEVRLQLVIGKAA
ncbi:HVO_A0114 family putative DNA-binding protein [Thiolapillus sp.]